MIDLWKGYLIVISKPLNIEEPDRVFNTFKDVWEADMSTLIS